MTREEWEQLRELSAKAATTVAGSGPILDSLQQTSGFAHSIVEAAKRLEEEE